jgi:hypothetical protein
MAYSSWCGKCGKGLKTTDGHIMQCSRCFPRPKRTGPLTTFVKPEPRVSFGVSYEDWVAAGRPKLASLR